MKPWVYKLVFYQCSIYKLVENNTISSKLFEAKKHIQQRNFLQRKFRTGEYPYDKISYGETSRRLNFLTAKFPYDEISHGETSRGEFFYGEISGHEIIHILV